MIYIKLTPALVNTNHNPIIIISNIHDKQLNQAVSPKFQYKQTGIIYWKHLSLSLSQTLMFSTEKTMKTFICLFLVSVFYLL